MASAKYTVIILILMSWFSPCCWGQTPEWKKKYDNPQLLEKMFAEPPLFYAPHFFWFWDDTLRNDQLTASMASQMMKQRINPGYAHPRSSMNRTDTNLHSLPLAQYLKEPWFHSFHQALEQTSKAGFTLGYCDDYDWPSGQAAGRVLEERPDLLAEHLKWKRSELKQGESMRFDSVDFVVIGELTEGKLDATTLRVLGQDTQNWSAPKGHWIAYSYTKEFHPGADGGRVNYLHPDLMKTFIPLVHEKYQKEFGEKMGRSIPGVFVDHEGDYGWHIAWSDYLAKIYKNKKHRDIRLWLPLLTEQDRDGIYVKARNDWFDMVSQAYIDCFFQPVVDWLDKRDMYVISNLWEESLQTQTSMVGDLMRITRQIPMPGNDCLVMKSQQVHDFKEVQSVAEFEDRPFMSEIMGVAGWDQSPQMMKMTVNAITSFGVNHIVPHGINLNRNIEHIPFPADWYTENPYWPYLHQWADFSRRASFVTRQTKIVADVLLFHPLESIWAEAQGMFSHPEGTNNDHNPAVWSQTAQTINNVYSQAMEHLNTSNIEFLVGDNHYIDKGAIISDDGRPKLEILGHKFSVLVLPPLSVLSRANSKKILTFARAGGRVVLLGQLPSGSPEIGKIDPVITQDMKELVSLPSITDLSDSPEPQRKLAQEVLGSIKSPVKLSGAGRLYTTHRTLGNTHYYWLANNTDSTKHFDAWFQDGEGGAEIWNCETGQVIPAYYSTDNGAKKVSLTLHPYEAYWLVFNPRSAPLNHPVVQDTSIKVQQIQDNWKVSYPHKDTIYRSSAKAWHGLPSQISYQQLRELMSGTAGQRSSFIAGSLERTINSGGETKQIPYSPAAGEDSWWNLVIPIGAKSILFPAEMVGRKVWIDGKQKKVSSTTVNLHKGANNLLFSMGMHDSLPASPIGFDVGKKNISTPLASWHTYGLDQYTGYLDYQTTITVSQDADKMLLDLGKVNYMAEVFINGKSIGARLWPPYKFDLSGELKKGTNTIKVRTGNLMVNQMALKDDLHQLRTWSWNFSPEPDLENFDSGLLGPVTLWKHDSTQTNTNKQAKLTGYEN